MTVRTWFRLVRRTAWEGSVPEVTIYFRAPDQADAPWTGGHHLIDLRDYQALIDGTHQPRHFRPWRFLRGITD